MPNLPIHSRHASVQNGCVEDPSEASTDSENSSLCSTASLSAGLQVKIKNTFLEVDHDGDNGKDFSRKPRRSKTCCAKLSDATAVGAGIEAVLTDDSDTDVSILSTGDSSFVDATPVHDDVMRLYSPYPSLARMNDAGYTSTTSPHADMSATSVSSAAEQLTLHVPLASLGICSSEIPEHTVTVKNSYCEGRNRVIDFRVVIGATDTHLLPTIPVPRSHGANHVPTSKQHTSVCCHWKNKGWCKYQSQCKFQHPLHKRGVGAETSRPQKMPHFAHTLLNQQYVQMHF